MKNETNGAPDTITPELVRSVELRRFMTSIELVRSLSDDLVSSVTSGQKTSPAIASALVEAAAQAMSHVAVVNAVGHIGMPNPNKP